MATREKLISAQELLAEQLRDPAFRAAWERTALARAVALAVVSYRAKHHLTQAQLAQQLGVRQPHITRLELGEHNPSLEMLQRLARVLGLRFIVEVASASAPQSPLTLPPGVEVLEDMTMADGSRVLVATG
ncbi:MAG TPA: helix-turn-helix transcriptional regulator [Chloroflexota bacterium]|nr:helix-turn-helix transcriptional regulator [Chloroflexota bacterium]